MQITDGGTDSTVTFTPGPASRYRWEASGPNPCPRCTELDGQVRTLESWESSAMPGLHKHCHCKLICVEVGEADSGWAFTDQYSHVAGVFNVDSSISHDPHQPGPQHLSKKNREEAEGAEDIAPYTAPYRPPPPNSTVYNGHDPYREPPPNTYNNQH
jgi:hypothetical protein